MDKPSVLVVDDNDATVTLVTALLQREFFVEPATDGAEAIEKLKTKQYAALLLDLRMPHLDGFGVLEFLEANHPAMLPRVLVVTAALGESDVARARAYGICDVVSKPFDIETLLAAVKQCVEPDDARPMGGFLSSGMILLLADVLRSRF
ncbi:MAG TPA: response regulator [Thermoanaerobaculia bacterium]|nr:response regulator [Thermoanaerobaculia bacterium]